MKSFTDRLAMCQMNIYHSAVCRMYVKEFIMEITKVLDGIKVIITINDKHSQELLINMLTYCNCLYEMEDLIRNCNFNISDVQYEY